jgi:hypothetical protein
MRFRPERFQSAGITQALLRPLTSLVDALAAMFDKNITIGENVDGFFRTVNIDVSHTFPLRVKNALGHPPAAVFIAQAVALPQRAAASVSAPAWDVSGDQILIHDIPGLTADQAYSITFLVLGG